MHAVQNFETDVDMSPIKRQISPPGKPELYNIAQDPYENEDLAEKHPDRVSKMVNELANWFEEANAERRNLPEAWHS